MLTTLFDNDYTTLDEHRYTLRDVVVAFGLDLGLDTYPIFDEAYRDTLNAAIYNHFEWRRIAASTPQLFVVYLNRRMCEQMPLYNAIYKKILATEDPFLTNVYENWGDSTGTSDSDSEATETSKSTSHTESDTTSIYSQTPASYLEDKYDPKYMSNLTHNYGTTDSSSEGETNSNANTSGNTTSDFRTHTRALTGYLGDSVTNAIVTAFLNTDLLVCDMLEPCFMQVWDDMPL